MRNYRVSAVAPMFGPLWTRARVMAKTGLTASQMERLIALGTFPPAVERGSRKERWQADGVMAWIASLSRAERQEIERDRLLELLRRGPVYEVDAISHRIFDMPMHIGVLRRQGYKIKSSVEWASTWRKNGCNRTRLVRYTLEASGTTGAD